MARTVLLWLSLVFCACAGFRCDIAHPVYVAPDINAPNMELAPILANEQLYLGRRLGFHVAPWHWRPAGPWRPMDGPPRKTEVNCFLSMGAVIHPGNEATVQFYSVDGGETWIPIVFVFADLFGDGPGFFGQMTMLMLLGDPQTGP
ncbi:MAG: hypothetical protein JXQ29_16650 [Planctomycetes bacterium]|nr:hypothetical protein [Planctomycetota bacterium]